MKIILAWPGDHASQKNAVPNFRIFADSSLMADKRQPLFLPRWSDKWQTTLLPCLRISRQGRNIATKFASRYYDAISVMAILSPENSGDISTAPIADNRVAIADETLRIGSWQAIDNTLEDTCPHVEISATHRSLDNVDDIKQSFSVEVDISQANRLIAGISTIASFKTGDIIILGNKPLNNINQISTLHNITENSLITAILNSQENLKLKIK